MKVLPARGMSAQVLDPLRACVKVVDSCDLSSAGTVICVKLLEMCCESVVPPYPNDSQ
jgi:hypothetical protein